MQKQKHLFIIPRGVYAAADLDEVNATIAGLREMGLDKLPYDQDVYIEVLATDILAFGGRTPRSDIDDMAAVTFGPLSNENPCQDVHIENRRTGFRESLLNDLRPDLALRCANYAEALLITLLATRNVVKSTRERKSAKLGIGKKHPRNRYNYTTTISLPTECDDDPEHAAPGGAKAPHLRRGHIRRQHYGPAGQFEKKIWIAPVFVNADPAFVNTRRHYNITSAAAPGPSSVDP